MKITEFFFSKNIFLIINIAVTGLVLALSLVIVRDFFQVNGSIDLKTILHKEPQGAAKKLEEHAVILKNNLFGFDAGQLTPLSAQSGKKDFVPSNVDYKLIGTIASEETDSFAILLSPEGKQSLYRIKSEVPGLGVIYKVEKDRILIGEKKTELKLTPLKGMENVITIPKSAPAGQDSGDVFVRQTGDSSFVLNEKMVEESINNPQRLMTDARLQPLYKDGKQDGFALTEVKKGGIYDSLGLRNGDVLLRINEYDVTNPETALQAFTALRGVERLQLDILRDNAKMSLTYHIK